VLFEEEPPASRSERRPKVARILDHHVELEELDHLQGSPGLLPAAGPVGRIENGVPGTPNQAEWVERRAAELLPVPYDHVVFTIPEELKRLFLGNPKAAYGALMRMFHLSWHRGRPRTGRVRRVPSTRYFLPLRQKRFALWVVQPIHDSPFGLEHR